MTTRTLYYLLAICLATVSCAKMDCPSGGGTSVSYKKQLANYHQLNVYDNISVALTYDTVQSLAIEAGEKLQPGIGVSVVNGILTLRNNNSCSWLRSPAEKISVHIHSNQLKKIHCYGSGNIHTTNTWQTNEMIVDAYEAAGTVNLALNSHHTELIIREENADFILQGHSDTCYVFCGQKGFVDLRNFSVNRLEVDQRSVRNIYAYALDLLNVKVQYHGNVYYKGTPGYITAKTYSSGQLLAMP